MIDDVAPAQSAPRPTKVDRFWFERPNDDLPFYNGRPAALSGLQWLWVMVAVAAGFAALLIPIPTLQVGLGGFIPAVLFFAIPLSVLAVVASDGWTAIFRRVRVGDVVWMAVFAVLNIVVTMVLGIVVLTLAGANGNPLMGLLPHMSGPDRLVLFAKTIPQLFGEEVLTILPFLAVVTLLHGPAGLSRRTAMVGAWVVSAVLFGLVHLPTYGWSVVQCLVIIGGARLVLTLPYVMPKNIWVSTGALIINDWTLMGGAMLLSSLGRH